jgi:hypothetical protein
MNLRSNNYWILALGMTFCLIGAVSTATAAPLPQSDLIPERPETDNLLPETTSAFIQIDNFRDMMEKMEQTRGAQLLQDENVSPLIDGLWEEVETNYADVQEDVGLSLAELTSLPKGEMTFAVITPRRKSPEFLLLMELNEDDETLDKAMDRGRELIKENDHQEDGETTEDGFTIQFANVGNGRKLHFFRHQDVLVGCTSREELDSLIDRWMGREVEKVRPFTDNRKFVTVMNRCQGTNDLQPEARFFVDPITLAKSSYRGNVGAQVVIGALPVLGIDNVLALGGSMMMDEEEFESIVHSHLLLANPRSGLFSMLSFKSTDYEPDAFIPHDVSNHWNVGFDLSKMQSELVKIIDTFQGQGTAEKQFEQMEKGFGISLENDIIPSLSGKVTFVQWMEKPVSLLGNANALVFGLDDPDKAKEIIEKLTERANMDNPDSKLSRQFKDATIYGESLERMKERGRKRTERLKKRNADQVFENEFSITPQLAIIDNSLVVSLNSIKFLERMIETQLGDHPALRDDEDYRELSDTSQAMLSNELPVGSFFANPQVQIDWALEMLKTQKTGDFLERRSKDNPRFAGFKRRLDENPLPEFEQLKDYFAKSAGFMTDDDTGLHVILFNLKSDE